MSIENVAKKFFSKNLEKYEGSREDLKQSLESLNAITVIDYMASEGISLKNYHDFKSAVLSIAEDYANKERTNDEEAEEIAVIPPNASDDLVLDDVSRKFMEEYKEHYAFDFSDSLDIEKFIESMELLNEDECVQFLEDENLNIDFDTFKKRLIELAPEFVNATVKKDNSSDDEDKSKEMAKIIYDRYMSIIYSTNIDGFENFFTNLDNADLRIDNEEEAQYLSNEQVKEVIGNIKKTAKNYVFDKILEDKKIKSLVSDFIARLSAAKSLDEIQELQNELNKIIDNKAMNKLNHFNKMLVFGELSKILDKKVSYFEKEKEEEKITVLKNKMPDMKIIDLFAYLNEFDKSDSLYDRVNDLIMNESVNRLMKDISKVKVEDLDRIKERINYSTADVYPDIRDEFKKRVEFEIDKEKARRRIYDIGTKVYLEESVFYYDDVNSFLKNDKADDIVLKNSKAIVEGYVLNSEIPMTVNDKESAVEFMALGYDITGYELKHHGNKIYIPEIVVKKREKRKFNKKIACLIGAAAVGCAVLISGLVNHLSNGNKKDVSVPKDDTPTISTEVNNTNQISDIKDVEVSDKVSDEEQNLEEEVEEAINIPGMNVSFEIDEDARVHSSKNFDTKGNTSYFNTHNIDVERTVAGYVLEDEEGRIKVYTNMNKVYDLVMNKNYNYLGVRTLNNYSKSDTDYEGYYKASDINFGDNTLVRSLKK